MRKSFVEIGIEGKYMSEIYLLFVWGEQWPLRIFITSL